MYCGTTNRTSLTASASNLEVRLPKALSQDLRELDLPSCIGAMSHRRYKTTAVLERRCCYFKHVVRPSTCPALNDFRESTVVPTGRGKIH